MTDAKRYKANGCGPDNDNKLERGLLWVTENGVSFQGSAMAFTLPMANLRIDQGGATGHTIRVTNSSSPDYFISTDELGILREPLLVSRSDLKINVFSTRRRSLCCIGGCVTLIIIIVGLVIGLIAAKDAVVGALARHFPPKIEHRIGSVLVDATVPPVERLTDPQLISGLDAIADPVLSAIPADAGFTSFTLYLSANPEPNAFALPGGYIVVNAGLILTADNADEVAGVIAHEAGHAVMRHSLQSVISRAGLSAVIGMLNGDAGGLTSILMDGGGFLLNQKYSRDFERQADEKAWHYIMKANVNPAGLKTFFDKLQTLQGGAGTPTILSTHPATADRIEALNARLKTLPDGKRWRAFPIDYNAYKANVRRAMDRR